MNKDNLLRLSMQFFAEGGDSGADSGTADSGAGEQNTDTKNTEQDNKQSTADIDKLVQARADKLAAEQGKKIASLQKELDKLRKAGMDAEELKKLEMADKEAELAEREKMLMDRENRLTAIKEIKAAGLDDGSDKALELVDFVMADSEDAIKNKVKVFGELVKRFVAAEVDKTFKQHGRQPNGSGTGTEDKKDKGSGVAEKIGAANAARMKQSRAALDYYMGGNK